MSEKRRGIPFVVAAPSGTGKTTICRAVVDRDPGLEFSVSHTTREPRPGEQCGVDYHFVTDEEFAALREAGEFVEWAHYNRNTYGTSWRAIREPVEEGRSVLLEIEVQGARQIRERLDDARFIFLLPPSMSALEQRLRSRGTDDEEAIARRLDIADREIEAAEIFDYALVNDDLEEAIAAVLEIVAAERSGNLEAVQRRYGRDRALASWSGGSRKPA